MTIYEIAALAGVSASTVSRVACGKPGVKESTRLRVQALLEQYSYSPNAAARSLVKGDSKIVGMLVEDIRTAHHIEGAHIIIRELSQAGYDCMIFNTGEDDADKVASIRSIASRQIDAVVMIGSTFQCSAVQTAIATYLSSVPVFLVNGYLKLPNVYGILADERQGVEKSVEVLRRKGCGQIAFVSGRQTTSNQLKLTGYEEGARKGDAPQQPIVGTIGELEDVSGGRAATLALLDQYPALDAIIYATDLIAMGGLMALRERSVAVPERMMVMGIDNSMYAEISYPSLTSLDNNILELSLTCADMLIHALNGQAVSHKSLVYSDLVERASTAGSHTPLCD